MGIRETLNRNPSITTGATIGIILVAIGAIVWQMLANRPPSSGPQYAFYSADDGATWIKLEDKQTPPFTHEGKEYVRATVYKCGSTTFAAYLERYTPEALQKIEAAKAKPDGDTTELEDAYTQGHEVKKPGAANKWVKRNTPAGMAIVDDVKCPDGTIENLQQVEP